MAARWAASAGSDSGRAVHPYDVFELVTLDIVSGNAPYLDWIRAIVGRAPG